MAWVLGRALGDTEIRSPLRPEQRQGREGEARQPGLSGYGRGAWADCYGASSGCGGSCSSSPVTAAGTAISILLAVAIAVMDFSLLPAFRGVGLATPVDAAWSNRR